MDVFILTTTIAILITFLGFFSCHFFFDDFSYKQDKKSMKKSLVTPDPVKELQKSYADARAATVKRHELQKNLWDQKFLASGGKVELKEKKNEYEWIQNINGEWARVKIPKVNTEKMMEYDFTGNRKKYSLMDNPDEIVKRIASVQGEREDVKKRISLGEYDATVTSCYQTLLKEKEQEIIVLIKDYFDIERTKNLLI